MRECRHVKGAVLQENGLPAEFSDTWRARGGWAAVVCVAMGQW